MQFRFVASIKHDEALRLVLLIPMINKNHMYVYMYMYTYIYIYIYIKTHYIILYYAAELPGVGPDAALLTTTTTNNNNNNTHNYCHYKL